MTKPPPDLPEPGIALTTAVRPRWWLAAPPRRLRVRRDGLWCWRSARGGSHALRPDAIAWGPGQAWLTVAGQGWSRQPSPAGLRQSGPQRLTLFAGSMPADAWRRLCVSALWRSRAAAGSAP